MSKVTERAVFIQANDHMTTNALYLSLQSAYRKNHSMETAHLKVKNDILMKMNSQHAVLLILLDLSAAFDTVDHKILLRRLHSTTGINVFPSVVCYPTVSSSVGVSHKGHSLGPYYMLFTHQSHLTSLKVIFLMPIVTLTTLSYTYRLNRMS